MKARGAERSRVTLDSRFKGMPPADQFRPPLRGWIKAVREALGMTSAQLARRLDIRQSSVIEIEKSEAKGTIQLATLRRAAAVLDCTLVYALVPNKPLEAIVRTQARKVARRRLRSVDHTMLLENQSVPAKDIEARLDSLARDVKPGALWDEA